MPIFIRKINQASQKQRSMKVPETNEHDTKVQDAAPISVTRVENTTPIRERVSKNREEMAHQPVVTIKEPPTFIEPYNSSPIGNELIKSEIGYDRIVNLMKMCPLSRTIFSDYGDDIFKNIDIEQFNTMGLIDFKNFIHDKTIALVANSSILLKNEYGKEIDAHDIVIRFNSFKIIPENTGSKTTIHVSIYLQDINLDVYVPIRIIVASRLTRWQNKAATIQPYKQGSFLRFSSYHNIVRITLSREPLTTGFTILLLLKMLGGYKKVSLYGFDMYSKNYDSVLRTDGAERYPISDAHNYYIENQILQTTADAIDKVYYNYVYYGDRTF